MRETVQAARRIQHDRFEKEEGIFANAQMASSHMEKYCKLDTYSSQLLYQSIDRLGLSARAYNRILKISRTIADIDGSGCIEMKHVAEAIQYRRLASANL